MGSAWRVAAAATSGARFAPTTRDMNDLGSHATLCDALFSENPVSCKTCCGLTGNQACCVEPADALDKNEVMFGNRETDDLTEAYSSEKRAKGFSRILL